MENKENIEIASGEIGFSVGSVGCMPLRTPAITIIKRVGDTEIIHEFATADDYKAWKELE